MLPSARVRTGLVRAIPAAALALIAAWEITRTERAGAGVPDDDAWKRAADVVRIGYQPGDLIVFAPRWIDPVGRLWLGDLIPVATAGRMDDARFGSVWEVSIRGAHAPEATGTPDVETDVDGGILVRHLKRPAVEVVTDFVASASSVHPTGDLDTTHPSGVVLAEVGFDPHRCVQLVPKPNGTVTITFPAAQLGSALVGYVGLADVFTRRDVREPGRLVVTIAGKEVARVEVGDEDGWVRFDAKTAPGPADVTFTATAVGPGARDRLICVAAEARR
jgi:hypothetical protein